MPRLEHSGTHVFFDLLAWEEWENPIDLVADIVDPTKSAKIAVNDRHFGVFLMHYMNKLPKAKVVHMDPIINEMRLHKSDEELGYMIHLGKALDKVWEKALDLEYSGRLESDLAEELHEIKTRIFKDAGKPKLVHSPRGPNRPSTGINTASAHGGGGDRVINPSDPIYWEMGRGQCMGYVGDKTRAVQVAPATDEYKKLYEYVRESQQTAYEACGPGVTCESIDVIGREVLDKYGYGKYLENRIGHGLGLDIHEHPYLVRGNKQLLEPGMVFSVEPGIYMPGKYGIRIEDIVYVTDDGCESFYHSTKEFHEVN